MSTKKAVRQQAISKKTRMTMSAELYEVLSRPRKVKLQICSNKSQIESLRSCLYPTGISYEKDKVQKPIKEDKLSQIEAEIETLEAKEDRLESEFIQSNADVKKLCNMLEDETEKTVVIMRFIGCQKFDDIATTLSYDVSWVYRIYQKAVKNLEEVINKWQ